jgi:enamine deaminase RidA (YjgF/YER057c/UK114 family)
MEIRRATTGNPWEREIGFSRAVRVGDMIYTAGTIASDAEGRIHGEDSYEQCMYIIRKLDGVLQELGGSLNNVVKVTCFLVSLDHSAGFSRAHAEVFGEVRPATTCVAVSELFGEGSLVELELIAAD